MKPLNIDSEVSLAQLNGGVKFVITDHALVDCTVTDDLAYFEIEGGYSWKRTDIKELIQFLKTVRKLIPKESE